MPWGAEGPYGYGWYQSGVLGEVGYMTGYALGGYPGAVEGQYLAQGNLGSEWMPKVEYTQAITTGEVVGFAGELPDPDADTGSASGTSEPDAASASGAAEPGAGSELGGDDADAGTQSLLDDIVSALSELTGVDLNGVLEKLAGVDEGHVGDHWNEYLAVNETAGPSPLASDAVPAGIASDAAPAGIVSDAAPAGVVPGAAGPTHSDFPQAVSVYDAEGNRYDYRWNTDTDPTAPDWVLWHVEYVVQETLEPVPEAPLYEPPPPAPKPPPPRPFRLDLARMYKGYEVPPPEEPPSIFDTDVYGTPTGQPAGTEVPSAGPTTGWGSPPPDGSVPPAKASLPAPNATLPPPKPNLPPPNASLPPPNASLAADPDADSMPAGRSMTSAPAEAGAPWSGTDSPPAPGDGGTGDQPVPDGASPGELEDPAPADDWTRARQIFSGFVEGIPEMVGGAVVQAAKGALYMFPVLGQALLVYDLYEAAEQHGGGLEGGFIAVNEMFNPAYGAIVAGVGAVDAFEAGDDRKLGNQLFHLGAGIVATAALLEGGPEGLKEGPSASRGAGVPWKTIGEAPSPNVVRQNYPNACGPACAATILRDLGGDLSKITQEEVMAAAGERYNPYGGIQPRDMAPLLNELDPRSDLTWKVDLSLKEGAADAARHHSEHGPWIAGTEPAAPGTSGHYVVVDGVDAAGNILIRDTAQGRVYSVTPTEFSEWWSGYFVARE